MVRIIIVGYMGSGKTTVGKALAQDMNITFYDLDWYIENRMHKTVSQIFAEKGEEGFIVRNDFRKRPSLEPIMAFQNMDEPLGQHQRDLEIAVVQTEQGAK